MFKVGQIVKISDVNKTQKDEFLDYQALKIIDESNFTGEITKIDDGIHFVSFKNSLGWVTQGYKADEIKVVK